MELLILRLNFYVDVEAEVQVEFEVEFGFGQYSLDLRLSLDLYRLKSFGRLYHVPAMYFRPRIKYYLCVLHHV